MYGNLDYKNVINGSVTKVPGGIGILTVIAAMQNTIDSYFKIKQIQIMINTIFFCLFKLNNLAKNTVILPNPYLYLLIQNLFLNFFISHAEQKILYLIYRYERRYERLCFNLLF